VEPKVFTAKADISTCTYNATTECHNYEKG